MIEEKMTTTLLYTTTGKCHEDGSITPSAWRWQNGLPPSHYQPLAAKMAPDKPGTMASVKRAMSWLDDY